MAGAEGTAEEEGSFVETLRVEVHQRIAIHEQETVQLQAKVLELENTNKEYKNTTEKQADLIETLKKRLDEVAARQATQIRVPASEDGDRDKDKDKDEDGKPEWHKKFDLDCKPRELKHGGRVSVNGVTKCKGTLGRGTGG